MSRAVALHTPIPRSDPLNQYTFVNHGDRENAQVHPYDPFSHREVASYEEGKCSRKSSRVQGAQIAEDPRTRTTPVALSMETP